MISSTILTEIFLILRRVQRDVITTVHWVFMYSIANIKQSNYRRGVAHRVTGS